MKTYSARPKLNVVLGILALIAIAAGLVTAGVLITASSSAPAVASEPQVIFYRDGGLYLSDLSGANVDEVAPASAQPSYGGWGVQADGQVVAFYTVVEGADVVLHHKLVESGDDRPLLTVAKFVSPEGLTSNQVANPPSVRVSPDGKLALVATPETVHVVDIENSESEEISISDPLGSYSGFSILDWSPDGKYAMVHASRANTGGGTNLIIDPVAGAVVGQVPGQNVSWSPDSTRTCSGLGGPAGIATPRIWISVAPTWETREAIPGAIIPALSCDWIDGDNVLFATLDWPLLEGEVSPLPTVIAEVYGATDKTKPEETKVFLGTTSYVLPSIGVADLTTGQIVEVSSLRQDISSGSTVLEATLQATILPSIIAVPSKDQVVVSVSGEAPTIMGLETGAAVRFLEPGDVIAGVLNP